MDKSTYRTITNLIILVIILAIFAFRFYDYVVAKNATLIVYTTCNTSVDNCFIIDNEEDAYFEFQLQPYKKVEIKESEAPQCLNEHSCDSFVCGNSQSCNITFCSVETLEENERCTDLNSEIDDNTENNMEISV